jgi:hypothetical protein
MLEKIFIIILAPFIIIHRTIDLFLDKLLRFIFN